MKFSPTDAIAVATPLIRILQAMGVPCYIGGSLASSMHGNPRSTIDADLVVNLRENQVESLCNAIEALYHADLEVIREAVSKRDSFNILHRETLMKIDVFVMRGYRYERQVFDHVKELPPDLEQPEETLPFCSVEDIILNKLIWYDMGGRVSDKQWSDLKTVMKIHANTLNRQYLQEWAEYLDVKILLGDALAEAGVRK